MAKPKDKINPNQIKTRDELMVRLINGVTKGGPQKDRRREERKRRCRRKVSQNEE